MAGCGAPGAPATKAAAAAAAVPPSTGSPGAPPAVGIDPLPGMPPVTDLRDIYAADRAGALSPTVAGFRPLIYAPNSESSSVDEIDPTT